jgi:hypothetical protein
MMESMSNKYKKTRFYRISRSKNVENENLFYAWIFEYQDKNDQWRQIRNYNTKSMLKEIAIEEKKQVLEIMKTPDGDMYICNELVFV